MIPSIQPRHPLLQAGFRILLVWSAIQFIAQIPEVYLWPREDFSAYYHAAKLVTWGETQHLYWYDLSDYVRYGYTHKLSAYIYPPPVAVALTPLAYVSYKTAGDIWFALQLVLLVHSAWLLLTLHKLTPNLTRTGAAVFLLVILNFPPLLGELGFGNINLLILWLIVCSLRFLLRGRDTAAGAVLSIAFLIKVTPIVLLVPLFAGKRRRALLGFCGATAFVVLLTMLVVGTEPFVAYIGKLRLLSGGTGYDYNVSFNGVFNRLLQSSDGRVAPFDLPHLVQPLSRLCGALVLGACAVLVWMRRSDVLYGFALLLCGTLLASPITWGGHLVLLLPAFLWLIDKHRARLAASVSAGSLLHVMLVGYVVAALLLVPEVLLQQLTRGAVFPIPWLSRPFWGLLFLWMILVGEGVALRQRTARAETSVS